MKSTKRLLPKSPGQRRPSRHQHRKIRVEGCRENIPQQSAPLLPASRERPCQRSQYDTAAVSEARDGVGERAGAQARPAPSREGRRERSTSTKNRHYHQGQLSHINLQKTVIEYRAWEDVRAVDNRS